MNDTPTPETTPQGSRYARALNEMFRLGEASAVDPSLDAAYQLAVAEVAAAEAALPQQEPRR